MSGRAHSKSVLRFHGMEEGRVRFPVGPHEDTRNTGIFNYIMAGDEIIVKFSNVSFEWASNKPILDEASFSVRKGSKITLMGQNGAGKSTIFQLITGESKPEAGSVNTNENMTIASAKQVVPREDLELTINEFFQKCFSEKIYNIDKSFKSVARELRELEQAD